MLSLERHAGFENRQRRLNWPEKFHLHKCEAGGFLDENWTGFPPGLAMDIRSSVDIVTLLAKRRSDQEAFHI
jgi:hypothetical protein